MNESEFKIGLSSREREKDMKKLMIAASVAACAVAGFALESANIVG